MVFGVLKKKKHREKVQESISCNMLVDQSLTSECFGNSTGYLARAAVKGKLKEKTLLTNTQQNQLTRYVFNSDEHDR